MDGSEISSVKPSHHFDLLRWAQMICCLVCMILGGVLYPKEIFHEVSIILVLSVSSAFWFITTVDVISLLLRERIRFKSWLMIAVSGFLMFFLGAGFTFKTRSASKVLMIALGAACVVTGILFLLDILWITYSALTGNRVKPYPSAYGKSVDKAVSVCFLFDVNEYECPKMKKRHNITVKPPRKVVTPSYGGTFPVSKDFTPLPSPDSKGKSTEPKRTFYANVPARSSRKISTSPNRITSTSPSRRSASPSRYGDDDCYHSRATSTEDSYQHPHRTSPHSHSPGQSSFRRNQLDPVPERDSPHRKRRSGFEDSDPETSSRRHSCKNRFEYPERDRPERDQRSQWHSTRVGHLDSLPEQDAPRTSGQDNRESRRSRRCADDQSRNCPY